MDNDSKMTKSDLLKAYNELKLINAELVKALNLSSAYDQNKSPRKGL